MCGLDVIGGALGCLIEWFNQVAIDFADEWDNVVGLEFLFVWNNYPIG